MNDIVSVRQRQCGKGVTGKSSASLMELPASKHITCFLMMSDNGVPGSAMTWVDVPLAAEKN